MCRNAVCEIWNSSSYCFNEVQSMCPFNSRAPLGSSVVADCVCDGGYYEAYNALSYGHQCVMCDPGYFCAVGGRTRCPTDMHSDAFTDNSDACYCNAGFAFVDQSTCEGCAPGTHKPLPSDGAYIACAPGSYQPGEAALGCDPCPDDMSSPGASVAATDCTSVPGFYMLAGAAVPCARGFFQPEPGQAECLACGHNDPGTSYYSTVDASADPGDCTQCLINSHIPSGLSGSQQSDCVCTPGFTGDTCLACPAGTAKAASGPLPCPGCPEDTFSSSGSTVCSPCHANSASSANSASAGACVCVEGFGAAPVNGVPLCVQCVGGQFKNPSGSCESFPVGQFASDGMLTVCVDCTPGTYADAPGAVSCESCPANSHSPAGSYSIDACECLPGYESSTECTACLYGHYKPATADDACLPCPAGKSTPTTGTLAALDCVACAAGTFSAANSSGIMCARCGLMMMIAFITFKSSLVPLLEGL